GLFTLDEYDLPLGGTLELEFRLPFTRRDKQYLVVCLQQTPGPVESHIPKNRPRGGPPFCLQYPSGELAKFRPDQLGFGNVGERAIVTSLPTNDWVDLALQFRPDGQGEVYVDRTFVGALALPLRIN